MAAEEQLDAAVDELRELDDPATWSAREALDAEGRKHLHIHDVHFRRREYVEGKVRVADRHLRELQAAFGRGADPGGPPLSLELQGGR